ncbi:MAG: fibronectin type III domain-containing protein [Rhodocyclaceae bacterium]|nr:fibronectin type III domain-containing protein [Rhodocyclaceae bacterium]
MSEATVYVDADDANVNGEIGATLTLAGIDVRLKTQKTGASWRFIGSIPPGQSFNFEALLQEKTPTLTLPAFGNLPDSLTIDHADVSLALPGGAFDFSGKIELNGPGWTFDLGSASFRIDALHGEVHLSGNDEEPEQTAALAGSFVFGDRVTNLVGDARVKLGSANVDTVVEVALRKLTAGDASKFKVDKITDQLSGGHLPFKQLVPDRLLDRVSTLSQLAISINLSKGIYLARGEFEGASAYFLYQSAVSPATSDGYVFAAGLGETFKFENLLSELKPIDDVVTVKDAKLAIYAAPDQGLETLKRVAMEFQSANWPLPDKTEPGLERGLLVSATIQPGTSKLFDKVFQIGDVVDRSELSLVAQIEVSPETNSVLASSFRADIREIKFLEDTIRLSELKVAFTTRQAERELTLDGTLFVRRVFAKDYAFHGQLQLTSLGMRGKLELVRDASVTDIREPFGLPGIEIKRLSVEVESSFSEQSTNRFALYGETLLGHPPVAGKSYNQVQVVTKLGLAQGRPVLMSLALQEHLDLGGFLSQCFTGDGSKWPDHFINLKFKAGSRIYYYEESAGSGLWKDEPAQDKLPAYSYQNGFNVDALVELTLIDPITLRFTLRCLLDQGNKPIGIEAHVAVGVQPVDLLFVQLAGKELKGDAYIGAPTLHLATHPTTTFGFSCGVNFFGKGFFSANVGISRTPQGNTQVAGKLTAAESLPFFGALSFDFTYTRKNNKNDFVINNWPAFEVAADVIKLFSEIKRIADAAKIKGCVSFADFAVHDQIKTRCLITPSAQAIDDNTLEFSLVVSYSIIGIITLEFDKVTVPVRLAKTTTFSQLPARFTEEIFTRAIPKIAEDMLGSPKNIALFLALTFGKEGVKIALALVCRGLINALIPLAVEAAVAALSIAGATLLSVMAAIALALIGISNDKSVDTAPRKPRMRKLVFDGKRFTGEWGAADYVDHYEFEASGPAGFATQRVGSIRGLRATLGEQLAPLVAGHYSGRVQGVRGDEKSGWSEKLSIEKLAALPVHFVHAIDDNGAYLKATWTGIQYPGLTYDLRLLLEGHAVPGQERPSSIVNVERWELAALAPGTYAVQLVVRGEADKYIASDESVSNPVVKLAPPVAEKLTYVDDLLSVKWAWKGDASATDFSLKLVADGIDDVQDVPPESASATTGRFVVPDKLAVASYRVRTKANPTAAALAHTAPSDWSSPSTCAIARLPPPAIKSALDVAVVDPFVSMVGVTVEHAIAGADVYHARLSCAKALPNVGFPSDGIGKLPLPDDYHGLAQIKIRAAKRNGEAIASEWVNRDIVRLAAPTKVAFNYRHEEAGVSVFTFVPVTSATVRHYEVKLFLMGTDPTLLEQRIIPASGASRADIPIGKVPGGGRIRAGLRAVATDQTLLPSAWALAPQVLTKLAKATVTAWTYDERDNCVRIHLQKAEETNVTYEVSLVESDRGPWHGSSTEIEIPNPFGPGQTGSYTVTARLSSLDPTVIDGDWQESPFRLTKLPPPTDPVLIWEKSTNQIIVSFKPGVGTQRHDVQLLVNDVPFGNVLPTEPNSAGERIPLDDALPAGQIRVQVRSSGVNSQCIPGDWVRSATALHRPQAYSQPRLLYRVGAEAITAEWPTSGTRVRLATQLLTAKTTPVGAVQELDAPAAAAIKTDLEFGDDLPPGEVRVRFRTMPVIESSLPGVWATSTQTLSRLSQASRYAEYQYADGTLTLTLFGLDHHLRPTAFESSFVGNDLPSRTSPSMRSPAVPPDHNSAVLVVEPKDFPAGINRLKVWTVGEDDRVINGASTYLMHGVAPISRPAINRISYASGILALSWDKIEPIFSLQEPLDPYRLRIDAGGGNIRILGVTPERGSMSGLELNLNIDTLDGLPSGGVWHVSVQAVGSYGVQNPGSGPWSEPADVLMLPAPTGLDLSFPDDKLSAHWMPPPSPGTPLTYELELRDAAGNPALPVWADLNATAVVGLDVSRLEYGARYTGFVRATAGSLATSWSEPATIVIKPDLTRWVQELRSAGNSATQSVSAIRQVWLAIPAGDLRAALVTGGYPQAEIDSALGQEAFYEQLGPIGVGNQASGATFDDLQRAMALNEPLSQIDIHYSGGNPGSITGIQAYYGHGAAKKKQPLHGLAGFVCTIDIPIDQSITGFSGFTYSPPATATLSGYIDHGTMIGGLNFSSLQRSMGGVDVAGRVTARNSFSLQSKPGGVCLAFFGSVRADRNLASLGMWMKYAG